MFAMFPRDRSGYFEDEYFNPWTSIQHPFCTYSRNPRYAKKMSSFWEGPVQFIEKELPSEEAIHKDNHQAVQRKRGGKRRPKTAKSRTVSDEESKPMTTNGSGVFGPDQQEENTSSREHLVKIQRERPTKEDQLHNDEIVDSHGHEAGMESNEDSRKTPEPEVSANSTVTCNESEEKGIEKEKMVVENEKAGEEENSFEENSSESEETVSEKEGMEEINEINENKEKNIIEEKLKMIDHHLTKARDLTPKDTMSAIITKKQQLYITEMLLRCILDLDMIETNGSEAVKRARKEAVREIQSCLDLIEHEES